MDNRPVGFFDSGVGGLSILNEFKRQCPNESTFYIADSANCPYGNKSAQEIIERSDELTRRLLSEGCKMIVVACNTATAAAIDFLREKYPSVPFVGLEPAIKPAALISRSGIVAVIATLGTFSGRLYQETKARFAKNVSVIATVADEFVELVERGEIAGERAEKIVEEKIAPLVKAGADCIVLGCTHFPHLRPLIERAAGKSVKIIDSSAAVVAQAKRIIAAKGLEGATDNRPFHTFVSTATSCIKPHLRFQAPQLPDR